MSSGGVRRWRRNRARLVITIEVEASSAHLLAQPAWRRDAMSALRDLVDSGASHAKLIDMLHRQPRRWTVLSEKVEVAG